MKTILVVYHSQNGHTLKMAQAVVRGSRSIKGVTVILKKAGETTLDDLLKCDGLIIGTPEYFGYMAGMIKDFFDRTYLAARGRKEIFKKPYVLFISAGNDGIGALNAIERILKGYQFKKIYDPVLAKGEIESPVLDKCEEIGKIIAAGCEAGIY